MSHGTGIKPFLKWPGGKSSLLIQYRRYLPGKIGNYFEPFLGGGAVFFSIYERIGGSTLLSDANTDLINTYQVVRDAPDDLIWELKRHKRIFDDQGEPYYYAVRASNPQTELEQAARFIFLNRTCFNGLYRVNRQGKFNVPLGDYENPKIARPSVIRKASKVLSGIELWPMDFMDAVGLVHPGDFVYMDPPYHSGFTQYTPYGFSIDAQGDVVGAMHYLDKLGARFMVSNVDSPFTRKIYSAFNIVEIKARRAINRDPDGRGPVGELLVMNY